MINTRFYINKFIIGLFIMKYKIIIMSFLYKKQLFNYILKGNQ